MNVCIAIIVTCAGTLSLIQTDLAQAAFAAAAESGRVIESPVGSDAAIRLVEVIEWRNADEPNSTIKRNRRKKLEGGDGGVFRGHGEFHPQTHGSKMRGDYSRGNHRDGETVVHHEEILEGGKNDGRHGEFHPSKHKPNKTTTRSNTQHN
jgi:hypothetical protein